MFLTGFSHPNILKLYAVCISQPTPTQESVISPLSTDCISDDIRSLLELEHFYITIFYFIYLFVYCWRIHWRKKKNVFIAWAYLRKSPKTLKCSMFTSQLYLCSDTVRKKGTGKVVFPASDLSCNRPPASIFGYFLFLKSTHQYCYKNTATLSIQNEAFSCRTRRPSSAGEGGVIAGVMPEAAGRQQALTPRPWVPEAGLSPPRSFARSC